MQDRDQLKRSRLGWVDQFPDLRVAENRLRVAQVGQHDASAALAGEQGAGMDVDDRVEMVCLTAQQVSAR
jgi:hypothetical protein